MSDKSTKRSQASKKRWKKRKGCATKTARFGRAILREIDVGAGEMFVAVPPDRDAHSVRVFDTFTKDLQLLSDWLVACGITTVAIYPQVRSCTTTAMEKILDVSQRFQTCAYRTLVG